MAYRWRVCISGLLVCTLVLGGCGDGDRRTEHADANSADRSDARFGASSRSLIARESAVVNAVPDVAATESAPAARKLVQAVVLETGESTAVAPLEDFRARIVDVRLSPEAKALPPALLAVERAGAFGVDWKPNYFPQISYVLHRKSPERGCTSSRGSTTRSTSQGPAVTIERISSGLDGKEPYSVSFEYLGQRDGKDHYLVTATIEESVVARPATAEGALENLAAVGNASAEDGGDFVSIAVPSASFDAYVTSYQPFDVKGTIDLRSIDFSADPQDPFTQVRVSTYADGRVETAHRRQVSYELVYTDEPFWLKLSERVLLHFGGLGVERYPAEPVQSGDQAGQSRKVAYRPCPECALSDAMAPDMLSLVAVPHAAQIP